MNRKKLIRRQLDQSLERFVILRRTSTPAKGWIRAVRDALGMTAQQLAGRLGIAQQSVARIERDELTGSVTIKKMRQVAESLDCEFVYGLVPRTSLEDTIRRQARIYATRQHTWVSRTMALEDQALSPADNERALAEMVDELVAVSSSKLWTVN